MVSIKLEDYSCGDGRFYTPEEAANRIQRVLKAATAMGVPDFVVNAQSNILVQGGKLEEAIEHGKCYLEAGATTVFVWGGSGRGTSRDEVKRMVTAFEGNLNVSLRLREGDRVTPKEAAQSGVSRCSIFGPQLQSKAMEAYRREAEKVLS